MQLLFIAALAVALCSVIFALQNNVPVTVTFLVWRFDSSLAMVLLMALALGAIIVALVSTPRALRSQWLTARQRSEITALKSANSELEKRLPKTARENETGTHTANHF